MSEKPTLGVVLVILVLVLSGLLLSSCGKATQHAGKWHCPMHPTYIADKPADCPICGMRLVPVEERAAAPTVPAYTCPMHPEVTSDTLGRCPKCGMKLVETGYRKPGAGGRSPSSSEAAGHAEYRTQGEGRQVLYFRNPMDPTITSSVPEKDSMGMDYVPVYADERAEAREAGIAEHAAVEITSEGLRLAGVQTVLASRESLARTIRAVGIVTADETRIRHVHTKTPGWIEKLYVNFTGQLVRKGEPILSIYSQELVASQEEYIKARETAAKFALSQLPEVRKGGEELAVAARRRLELFDVPGAFIDELERTGEVRRTVTLDAPVSGFVTMKDAFEGQQIEPAMELFTIADLSRVWVVADFYEYEAQVLRLGEQATVELPYDPGRTLEGRIAFIAPTVATDTRTLKVRFEFPNPGLALKPGMFANVELRAETAAGVVIPDSAVMNTGERQVVFVGKGDGVFEPRELTVGIRSGGKAQVLSGVAVGDRVVIRANFLLDSESRLRAALSVAGGAASPPSTTASPLPPEPPPLGTAKPPQASLAHPPTRKTVATSGDRP